MGYCKNQQKILSSFAQKYSGLPKKVCVRIKSNTNMTFPILGCAVLLNKRGLFLFWVARICAPPCNPFLSICATIESPEIDSANADRSEEARHEIGPIRIAEIEVVLKCAPSLEYIRICLPDENGIEEQNNSESPLQHISEIILSV